MLRTAELQGSLRAKWLWSRELIPPWCQPWGPFVMLGRSEGIRGNRTGWLRMWTLGVRATVLNCGLWQSHGLQETVLLSAKWATVTTSGLS